MNQASVEFAIDRLRQIMAASRNEKIRVLAADAIRVLVKPETLH